MDSAPLELWTGRVEADWIDYNGHMNEGFYGLVFSWASDEYLTHIGFDEQYRTETLGSFYTVETHITFLEELALAAELRVRTLVVGVDDIRLHLVHELVRDRDGEVAATQECLMLHVDTGVGRVRPMADPLLRAASADAAAHAGLVDPDQLGRVIRGPARAAT